MSFKKNFLVLVTLFFFGNLQSQNLVVNPSFEITNSNCANFGGEGFRSDLNPSWDNANSNIPGDSCSSPDLFSACNLVFGGPGPTFMPDATSFGIGWQYSRTGTRHVGLIAYSAPLGISDGYREYIQGHTTTPLTAGTTYCVSFYVSLGNGCPYAIKDLSVYFSNNQYLRDACTQGSRINVTPQLTNTCGVISDTLNWVRLQWNYTATGGEKYFVIGNFFNDAGTTKTNVGGTGFGNYFAYYFVDDVSIIPTSCCFAQITNPPTICQTAAPTTFTVGSAVGASCNQTITGTWSGPGINASTGVFTPSIAGVGTHTITYSTTCGYVATTTITVSPCQTLTACIENNGSITVSNGVAPYTWSTFQPATSTPITNQAQCTACGGSWTPFINQCLSGTTPLTSCNSPAQWVNFATGTNATAPSGANQVNVTDGSGTSTTFTISNLQQCNTTPCPTLVATPTITNITCNGLSNGIATINTTGGTAPYSYTWTGGTTTLTGASQNGLAVGTYSVNITDAANCPGTTTVTITQPIVITLSSSNIIPSPCGSSVGSATVLASGGTGAYSYSWSPAGGNAATGSNLAGGNYVVTVSDANSCQKTISITIPSPGGPNITNITTIEPSCTYVNSGQIIITASGGNGTLSYQINSGTTQSSNVFNNLAAGNYTITVTDANNCSNSIDTALHLPIPIQLAQGTIVGADCGVSNGSATVSASSGSGNYTYSWVPSGQTSATATNLVAGVYDAIVTDSQSGCKDTLEFIVPSIGGPSITNITANSPTCNGSSNGSLVVTATGGTSPYNYVIGTGTPQSGNTFSNLSAGTYQVTVTDANGCPATQNQVISNPSAVIANAGVSDTICIGQNTTLTASGNGGTGSLNYTWSNSLPGMNPNVSPTTTTSYSLTVTDANGCTGTSSVQIVVLPVPNAQVNPSVTTGNYPLAVTFANTSSNSTSYAWDFGNGQTQASATNAAVNTTYNTVGTFNVILIATNGQCTDTWTGTITTLPIGVLVFEVPNVFSPNGDTNNDTYGITSINAASQEVVIVDRWGVKMVELNTPNTYWDGKTSNGVEATDGVYFMKYRIKGLDGSEKEGQTFLHLIR